MATQDATRAARERKQKIFVAVGGLFLLALLAYQLPKLLGGSSPATTATTVETTASETTASETTAGETEPGTTGTTAIPVALVDTDRPLTLGPGQLRSFSLFELKDPFVQQIAEEGEAPDLSPTSAGRAAMTERMRGVAERAQERAQAQAPSKSFSIGKAAAGATILSVNGVKQVLEPGRTFPTSDPVFVLVSEQPNAKTVVVGLSGGEYANGGRRTKLSVGKPLVLMNTTTGVRYRLLLVSVGDGKAEPPAGGKP